jgi:hypothetical protein
MVYINIVHAYSVPFEKDEPFPPVLRLADVAFPFDLE